ncbi:MAG: hypothetical protein HQ521_11360 [Bacteroidetes bacterium]|nr:hypothetical protein [Bacteroidota bacterium]
MNSNENFHIIESLGLTLVSHTKILNQQSIEAIISGLVQNPFFRDKFLVLIDIRDADIKMTSNEIVISSQLVYEGLKETGIKKFAILASAAQMNKAVEFVHAYRESSKYQVFSSLNATLYWLGITIERKSQIQVKLDYLSTY